MADGDASLLLPRSGNYSAKKVYFARHTSRFPEWSMPKFNFISRKNVFKNFHVCSKKRFRCSQTSLTNPALANSVKIFTNLTEGLHLLVSKLFGLYVTCESIEAVVELSS